MIRIIFLTIWSLILMPTHSYSKENSGKLIFRKEFDNFTTSFESDYRYNESGLSHRHYDIGIKLPFLDSWSTSINYRSVYQYKGDKNKWELEKRPHISLQKVIESEFIKFEFRTRQEYRYRSNKNESARNRFRIMIKSNKAVFQLKPFIGNEAFYDMSKERYNKNWLVIGVAFPKNKFGNYSIYYKYVSDLDKKNWTHDYSIVIKAIYEF